MAKHQRKSGKSIENGARLNILDSFPLHDDGCSTRSALRDLIGCPVIFAAGAAVELPGRRLLPRLPFRSELTAFVTLGFLLFGNNVRYFHHFLAVPHMNFLSCLKRETMSQRLHL